MKQLKKIRRRRGVRGIMKYLQSILRQSAGLLLASVLSCLMVSTYLQADENSFREEFLKNYKGLRFEEQAKLVKKNKDIIPNEIRKLITDAMAEEGFEKMIFLLDAAKAMAYMNKHWHGGDEGIIHEVESIISKEVQKENERVAELMKWKTDEKFLGNLVMKEHMKEMGAAGLSPVLYPHWIHRIWFQCKVCHDDIFVMKRWSNNISQEQIIKGKQCGVCHNGKIAFGANEQCERCHIAGKPEARALYDVKKVDHKKIKEVASRLGSEWNFENLPGGEIPLDKYKFIDWLELKRRNVFSPLPSLDKSANGEVRDNRILFKTDTSSNDVLFDHKIHSTWIKCSTCHPAIFKEELGSNDVDMLDISRGMFCGHCHGKVSFTFAACKRCHSQPKGKAVKGALTRKEKTPTEVTPK